MTRHELARLIDHSALKPQTTETDIAALCNEAHTYGFATVCVMPYFVPLATSVLRDLGSHVAVCTVAGFPNGAHHTAVKMFEAKKAMSEGAREIDMVMNISAFKSGHYGMVEQDIYAVAEVARSWNGVLKVILETSLLSNEEKQAACEIAGSAGADFVKTCTGFNGGSATVEDVALLRASSAPLVHVKASGGIRDLATAIALIEAGAERIGTSAGVAIINEIP